MPHAHPRSFVGVLVGLAVFAPFNVKLTNSDWTDLQLRILVVASLVAVATLVVQNLSSPTWHRPDKVDVLAYFVCTAVWVSALLSDDIALGAGGAARLSVAILLVPAVRGVVRTEHDVTQVLRGLALGSCAGALVGLSFWLWGADLDPTSVFVGRVTKVGPFNRLTRPWAHANIAAMAIGATLAATAVLNRRLRSIAAGLLVVALVLTISRGGLLAGGAAAVTWVGLRRQRVDTIVVAGLVGLAALVLLTSSAWATRSDQLGDEAFYALAIDPPAEFSLDEDGVLVDVMVTNQSSSNWLREGEERVLISARWFGDDGLIWSEDWWELPVDLAAGDSVIAPVRVEARLPPGSYEVRWDLVIPNTAYFGQFLGQDPVLSRAEVRSSSVAFEDVFAYELVPRQIGLDRQATWQLAWRQFKGAPFFGRGPNQLGEDVLGELDAQNVRVGAHAHNIVLEPLAAWGLVGTLPFLALGLGGVGRALRRAWRSRDLAAAAIATGLVAVVVHGMVDWPLVVITTSIPVGMLMGLAWSDLEEP